MTDIAKLFMNGRSQAVRLPRDYRFEDCDEVYIRRDPTTGDVILSRRPADWAGFLAVRDEAVAYGEIPADFPREDFPGEDNDGEQPDADRDPFEGWRE